MRYTPGPWRMKSNGELWSYPRGGAPSQIGQMYWSGKQEDRAGNARLISFAADLSEDLQELYRLVSQPSVVAAIQADQRIFGKARLIIENSRQTLEQATGEKLPDWPHIDPTKSLAS